MPTPRSEIFHKESLSLAKLPAGGNTPSETRLDGVRTNTELPSHARRAGKSLVGALGELDSSRRRPPRHHPTRDSLYSGQGIPWHGSRSAPDAFWRNQGRGLSRRAAARASVVQDDLAIAT